MTNESGGTHAGAVRVTDDNRTDQRTKTAEAAPLYRGTEPSKTARSYIMARMNLNSCPRCNGAVLDYVQPTEDSTMCIMCGWLDRTVSESVLTEVKNHLASHSSSTTTHTHRKTTRGKPQMSCWEREKKRRSHMRMRPEAHRNLIAS